MLNNDLVIIGNGNSLCFPDNDNEHVYILHSVYLTNWTINIRADNAFVPRETSADFHVVAGKVEYAPATIMNTGLIRKCSIMELLKIVNEQLEERK